MHINTLIILFSHLSWYKHSIDAFLRISHWAMLRKDYLQSTISESEIMAKDFVHRIHLRIPSRFTAICLEIILTHIQRPCQKIKHCFQCLEWKRVWTLKTHSNGNLISSQTSWMSVMNRNFFTYRAPFCAHNKQQTNSMQWTLLRLLFSIMIRLVICFICCDVFM